MSTRPADGERHAARGYRWQYDHIAAQVYQALVDRDFSEVRLTDPDAGRVDDLVLIRRSRADAFQFRGSSTPTYITFRRVVSVPSGPPNESLLRSLANGWRDLRLSYPSIDVHLVTEHLASSSDRVPVPAEGPPPSPRHFKAFLTRVLEPIRNGTLTVEDVDPTWAEALANFESASGLSTEDFEEFLRSLHIETGATSGLPVSPSARRDDILELSDALWRAVSEATSVVVLDEQRLLSLVGWNERPRLRSAHEFPVDVDSYVPIGHAINSLDSCLRDHDRGYVALLGPPGAGKSTLLNQTLSSSSDTVIRYFAYVPGSSALRARMTAQSFLHDLVVMLTAAGLHSDTGGLPSHDISRLRSQLHDCLDVAATSFESSGRRTIIVVDGLDHVAREELGADGLLGELPRPSELPPGVIFLVGSRTLTPLGAHARQQVQDRESSIDLGMHPLAPSEVKDVCQRLAFTRDLGGSVHERIVELCAGHPLSLGYLLNRIRELPAASVVEELERLAPYSGDIGAEYESTWAAVRSDAHLLEILKACSRLRIGFTLDWLNEWAVPEAVTVFRRELLHLFVNRHDGWHFFHDSFRQFAADHTAPGDEGWGDPIADQNAHAFVADRCRSSPLDRFANEELYHRYHAGDFDAVLELSTQSAFRDQYLRWRSPSLIRSDILAALSIAAERQDVESFLSLMLAAAEESERTAVLEDVNLPEVLFDVGLVGRAILYSGDNAGIVNEVHAFGLAASLGRIGDPAGRRLFDLAEHRWMSSPDRSTTRGLGNDAEVAWTRAAVTFRPWARVIEAIRARRPSFSEGSTEDEYEIGESWSKYVDMVGALIDFAREERRSDILAAVAAEIDELRHSIVRHGRASTDEQSAHRFFRAAQAFSADLSTSILLAQLDQVGSEEEGHVLVLQCAERIGSSPLHLESLLDLAEVLRIHGERERVTSLLDRTDLGSPLSSTDLSSIGDRDAVHNSFRYWRLRYQLAPPDFTGGNLFERSLANSVANDDPETAAMVDDINATIRTLAAIGAAAQLDSLPPDFRVWELLAPLIDRLHIQPSHRTALASTVAGNREILLRLIVEVSANCGRDTISRVVRRTAERISAQPDAWSLHLGLDLAEQLETHGISVPWHEGALAGAADALLGADRYSRVDAALDLVHRYLSVRDSEAAKRMLQSLPALAFGVGYRKDHQYDSWMAWMARSLAEGDDPELLADAGWFAQVLASAEPLTEGAPGTAAVHLPGAAAIRSPISAVRLFEFLVRNGTVDHMDTLANLVETLVSDSSSPQAVESAVAITARIIAPCSDSSHPTLLSALVGAGQRSGVPNVRDAVLDQVDVAALGSLRSTWRTNSQSRSSTDGLQSTFDDTTEPLELDDGRVLDPPEASALITSVDEFLDLLARERLTSVFQWSQTLGALSLSGDDMRRVADALDVSDYRHADLCLSLARLAEEQAAADLALELARRVMTAGPSNGWSTLYGGARLRAAEICIRLDVESGLRDAYLDIVSQVAANRWLPGLLVSDMDSIIQCLDPGFSAVEAWPAIREHILGTVEATSLSPAHVFSDLRCRWWFDGETPDVRIAPDVDGPEEALAELAVGHLSHPTWVIRDGAAAVVTHCLKEGSESIARALSRFVDAESADDLLEQVGRCVAASREQTPEDVSLHLDGIEEVLAAHESQLITELARAPRDDESRALPAFYNLATPPVPAELSDGTMLAPHEFQYELLARASQRSVDTLKQRASTYARNAMQSLPADADVVETLRASGTTFRYPSASVAASRAGFGRVLADIHRAGFLDDVPTWVREELRSVDLDVIDILPERRPLVVAESPGAGHDQTVDRWHSEAQSRLNEIVEAHRSSEYTLIGAISEYSVLNWGYLDEALECGTTLGEQHDIDQLFHREFAMRIRDLRSRPQVYEPTVGDSLVVHNLGHVFSQVRANWVAFRPSVASLLGWESVPHEYGAWTTRSGDLAVKSVWWVDGWLGRGQRAFDDVEAEGHAVLLTPEGLDEITSRLGTVTVGFRLQRSERSVDGPGVTTVRESIRHLAV